MNKRNKILLIFVRHLGLLLFVITIVFYKQFGIEENFQEWYHLIWQWLLIHIGAYFWFTRLGEKG